MMCNEAEAILSACNPLAGRTDMCFLELLDPQFISEDTAKTRHRSQRFSEYSKYIIREDACDDY